MSLNGKVAIITGGSRGIGGACSKLLASRGAHVVLTYLNNADSAQQLVAEIEAAGGKAQAVQSDVRDTEQVNRLVETAYKINQRIDIMVSSAPAGWAEASFREIDWETYRGVVNAELKAAFDITKAVVPIMTAQHEGRLIYMASDLAKHPIPGAMASGTGKATLITFVRYVAAELGSDGITANVVAPGLVETELNQYMPIEEKQAIAAMTPLQRLAQPEDIAGVIAFLASDDSRFVTGGYIPVSGGLTIE